VTVTVCSTFQDPVVNVRLEGEATTSPEELVIDTVTALVGTELNTTVYVELPVGSLTQISTDESKIPAASLSRTSTDTEGLGKIEALLL
jgi:hypothetical protein